MSYFIDDSICIVKLYVSITTCMHIRMPNIDSVITLRITI